MPLGAFAATGNGCDENSNNDYINPELALCSTHVYNIGGITNPDDEARRQIMRDVVALKTTIMTQQMYRQYEYLESMIKRFKTQLEKAVLTTKLQAAGASDGSNNSSSSSGGFSIKNNNSYVVVDDAKDCNMESGTVSVLQCVLDNITVSLNAIEEGKVTEARRQLQKDIEVADNWGKGYKFVKPTKCNSMSGTPGVRNCAYDLRPAVTAAIEEYNRQNRVTIK